MALTHREDAMRSAIAVAGRTGVIQAFGAQRVGGDRAWWVKEAPNGRMLGADPFGLEPSTIRWVFPTGEVVKLA